MESFRGRLLVVQKVGYRQESRATQGGSHLGPTPGPVIAEGPPGGCWADRERSHPPLDQRAASSRRPASSGAPRRPPAVALAGQPEKAGPPRLRGQPRQPPVGAAHCPLCLQVSPASLSLGLCDASAPVTPGSVPGQGTRSHTL